MIWRIASIIVMTGLVVGSGIIFGTVGLLLALPIAMLISFATEKLIARVQPDQSAAFRRRR